MNDPALTVYHIDAEDRLVFANEGWDAFARETESPEMLFAEVEGDCLWDFIADRPTRHLNQQLTEDVREKRRLLCLPFRCDDRKQRRYMEMTVSPLDNGGVEFSCELLRSEPHDTYLPPVVHCDQPILRMCSWCNRLDIGGDRWMELAEALAELRLFEADSIGDISHSLCADCNAAVRAQMTG